MIRSARHQRVHLIDRSRQHAGQGGESHPEPIGERDHPRHVDPERAHQGRVLGGGAQVRAELGRSITYQVEKTDGHREDRSPRGAVIRQNMKPRFRPPVSSGGIGTAVRTVANPCEHALDDEREPKEERGRRDGRDGRGASGGALECHASPAMSTGAMSKATSTRAAAYWSHEVARKAPSMYWPVGKVDDVEQQPKMTESRGSGGVKDPLISPMRSYRNRAWGECRELEHDRTLLTCPSPSRGRGQGEGRSSYSSPAGNRPGLSGGRPGRLGWSPRTL